MSLMPVPSFPPQITLFDLRKEVTNAWVAFQDTKLSMVQVYCGEFVDLECSAIVSPCDSFGFMDGVTDLVYTAYFGESVQKVLQEKIRRKYHGELLIGQAEIVSTGDSRIPYFIAAPIMRVPMRLGKETVNPYLAMRAVMDLWLHGKMEGKSIRSFVRSIAVPGFATDVGCVPASICARQQFLAIREALVAPSQFPPSWQDALTRHQRLCTDRPYGLQED